MTNWEAAGIAGAFLAGIVVGGIAVARVTRSVMSYLRNERNEPRR